MMVTKVRKDREVIFCVRFVCGRHCSNGTQICAKMIFVTSLCGSGRRAHQNSAFPVTESARSRQTKKEPGTGDFDARMTNRTDAVSAGRLGVRLNPTWLSSNPFAFVRTHPCQAAHPAAKPAKNGDNEPKEIEDDPDTN